MRKRVLETILVVYKLTLTNCLKPVRRHSPLTLLPSLYARYAESRSCVKDLSVDASYSCMLIPFHLFPCFLLTTDDCFVHNCPFLLTLPSL